MEIESYFWYHVLLNFYQIYPLMTLFSHRILQKLELLEMNKCKHLKES